MKKVNEDIVRQLSEDLRVFGELKNDISRHDAALFIATKYSSLFGEDNEDKNIADESDDYIEVAGIKWAKSNLKIGDKEYFTFDEAQDMCPKGWRLPTNKEWAKLCTKCDYHFDSETKEGVFADKKTGAKLRLPALGLRFSNDCLDDNGTSSYYWSSTQYSPSYGYSMCFDSSYINPFDNYDKMYGLSVRCVRDSEVL